MDRATMRRIFEPFFTTKTETGTGLGMWVVAQLVERHHGHMRVWSTQRAHRQRNCVHGVPSVSRCPAGKRTARWQGYRAGRADTLCSIEERVNHQSAWTVSGSREGFLAVAAELPDAEAEAGHEQNEECPEERG
jgi:signal transduction histidine kinase